MILTINASPKQDGTVANLLKVFEKELTAGATRQVVKCRLGIKLPHRTASVFKRINLYDYDLPPHDGNLDREPLKYPFIEDIRKANAIVIATPTYWFNMPGQLKNFIDVLTEYIDWDNNDVLLEGKKLGVIAVSPGGGSTNILENLALTLNTMGMIILPYSLMFFGSGDLPDNPNGWSKKNIKELAQRIALPVKEKED